MHDISKQASILVKLVEPAGQPVLVMQLVEPRDQWKVKTSDSKTRTDGSRLLGDIAQQPS